MKNRPLTARSTMWLFNRAVHDERGARIGRLRDLVLDVPRGTIAYAVIAAETTSDHPARDVAVPWNELRVDEHRRCVIVTRGRQVLDDAPSVDAERLPNFADVDHHAQLYRMLGRQHAPDDQPSPVRCFDLD